MESNRDGGDSTRQNRKFEPRVAPLEQRVALDGSRSLGPIPPNVELLESQTQIIVAIGATQAYPGFLIPGNMLGDYVNQWGDPVWNLDNIYNPNQGSLVDLPISQIPAQPIPTPTPTTSPVSTPIAAPAPAPAPVPSTTIPSWMEADMAAIAALSPLRWSR